jgi:hypothetical protein
MRDIWEERLEEGFTNIRHQATILLFETLQVDDEKTEFANFASFSCASCVPTCTGAFDSFYRNSIIHTRPK